MEKQVVSHQKSDVGVESTTSAPSPTSCGEREYYDHSRGAKHADSTSAPVLNVSESEQSSAKSSRILQGQLKNETAIKISTFYQFTDFSDYESWQAPLRERMAQHGVKGSILLAEEGINATIAGPEAGVDTVLDALRADERFKDLFVKDSWHDTIPFTRAKVRLKKETITLKQPSDVVCMTGEQVSPAEWNRLLDDPEVLVLDTRNTYETHIGTFKGAEVWPLADFQEIVDRIRAQVDKKQKVAMFCTGGVRCEKLSSWMMMEGYENLYQLEGGIIHYLNEIPAQESKWEGACFVFDHRVALTHGSKVVEDITMCPGCGHPLTPEDRQHPHYIPANHCAFCESMKRH